MPIKIPGIGTFYRKGALDRPVKLTDGKDAFFTFMPNWEYSQQTQTVSGQAWAYNNCPPVNSIINRKVRAFTNGRWRLVNENGDPVTREYGALSKLLKTPNPLQSWDEFIAQAKTYEQVFGEVYILPVTPVGMSPEYAAAVWVVPNWFITEKITGKVFGQTMATEIIEGYVIGGVGNVIPPDQILRIRDVSIAVTQNPLLMLHGQSRMFPLGDVVSNVVAAYKARNVMITRKGALGILSNDGRDVGGTIPLKPQEKDALQKDFASYGLSHDQYQVIITNASMKWQPMTFSTRDLMLFEEVADGTRAISDAYDYPMFLLGFKEGSTFSNVGEAKKTLYQDAIIPEAEIFARAFSRFFNLPDGVRLQVSYQHLEIFQRSRKEVADAVRLLNQGLVTAYQNKIITLEEWRYILSNTLLPNELSPTDVRGNTYFEGPTPVTTPGNQVHAEQPKPRT